MTKMEAARAGFDLARRIEARRLKETRDLLQEIASDSTRCVPWQIHAAIQRLDDIIKEAT